MLRLLHVSCAAAAVCASLLLSPGIARAQDDFGRPGLYLGGGWFRTVEDFEDDLGSAFKASFPGNDASADVGDTRALQAVLGVRMGERWALELVGEQNQDLDVDLTVNGLTAPVDLELRTLMLMGKAYLLTGRIQPYLTAGYGIITSRATLAGAAARDKAQLGRLGLGLEVYMTRNVVVGLQAAYSRSFPSGFRLRDNNTLDFYSVGGNVLLRF